MKVLILTGICSLISKMQENSKSFFMKINLARQQIAHPEMYERTENEIILQRACASLRLKIRILCFMRAIYLIFTAKTMV